ncbi:MAG: ferrous iron transporter B [Clostridia bacterium]|nr:ferrous iron transporter B [Clostridia bacterium]
MVEAVAAEPAAASLAATAASVPSSYTLELPPYRKPQVGKVIIRSIFDRTLFVLGRAAAVAAPAGLVIWLMANITVGEANLLTHVSEFLDPFAKIMGLDGVILMAFILGFPANEIVIPIIIMTYLAKGTIFGIECVSEMKEIFLQNGWTWLTAVNTIIFSLMHWPCSTTLITIKKETGSFKWAALSAVIPTVLGITFCIIITAIAKIFI